MASEFQLPGDKEAARQRYPVNPPLADSAIGNPEKGCHRSSASEEVDRFGVGHCQISIFSRTELCQVRCGENDLAALTCLASGMVDEPNPTSREAINDRMRLLVDRFQLDGEGAAKAGGVATESAVSQWKSSTVPAWSTAVKLCDKLGVTMDWIYRGNIGSLPPPVYQRLYGEAEAPRRRSRKRRPLDAAE